MSSLWTPGGEHHVPREESSSASDAGAARPDDAELAEAEAALRNELQAARERLASVPAAQVVANHAMGLYELAAIHLSSQPPHFADAALAIDALGAVVEGLGERLGESASVLKDALHQIRLAFVQVRAAADASSGGGSTSGQDGATQEESAGSTESPASTGSSTGSTNASDSTDASESTDSTS